MRIKQLEYLEAVIETGSINEAAKRLYLTQPSLSSAKKWALQSFKGAILALV